MAHGERTHEERISALYKAILRLAFNYYGHEEELDRQLDAFRDSVKRGLRGHALEEQIRTLVDTVLKLGRTPSTNPEAELEVRVDTLRALTDRLQLPPEAAVSLRQLVQRLDELKRLDEVEETVKELAALISAASLGTGPLPAASEVSRTLLTLLEQISFPGEFSSEIAALRVRLQEARDEQSTREALRQFSTLIIRSRQQLEKEVRSLEEFLGQITEELAQMKEALLRSQAIQQAGFEDGEALNRQVREQMDDIHQTIDRSDSLEALKERLRQNLDTLHRYMDEFVGRQQTRRGESDATVETLNRQLQNLESEAEKLRNCVLEEHARALTDGLTGIANRLAFEERLSQEHARWRRRGSPLSLVLLDIDHFKVINDTFGHPAGDRVLRNIASLMAGEVREVDLLARYGGEEFVLLLPDTDLRGAGEVAEKLRRKVDDCNFHYREQPVAVTVSAGVSEFHQGDTPEEVLERADRALYQAKAAGRNQVRTEQELPAAG
ncbi:MAG: GGDEF domain-containing protein [Gammaproteobacteria bacterium]|nr:MAG: GGDEF domain-containing protein [Gammaproteobacteria bacterium]